MLRSPLLVTGPGSGCLTSKPGDLATAQQVVHRFLTDDDTRSVVVELADGTFRLDEVTLTPGQSATLKFQVIDLADIRPGTYRLVAQGTGLERPTRPSRRGPCERAQRGAPALTAAADAER
ncbi:hypothetical protein ACNAW0_29585 [Micromonospora sp. SL1-18]|uniref:hypothetical protein n=1 Tax=Micromonospora sp. SL1-18 TaxID=3399128 RepID=UPI003A4E3BDB